MQICCVVHGMLCFHCHAIKNKNAIITTCVYIMHEPCKSVVLFMLCSVFTVTPSKIKMQAIQYRKSRIWEMKEDQYANSLAKNQVCAICHKRDIRKNVLPKFIKLFMETPCWCPFEGHKCGRRKPTETSVFKCVNSSLEKLIKIKVIFILRQGMFG